MTDTATEMDFFLIYNRIIYAGFWFEKEMLDCVKNV